MADVIRRVSLGILTCLSLAAQQPVAKVDSAPGGLVRWSAPGTKRCSMKGRSWLALRETCYYPVDLTQPPGPLAIARWSATKKELAQITVTANEYGTESIELPDIPQAHPSQADINRDLRDRTLLGTVFHRTEGPARFTLPLGPPAVPLPRSQSFGVKRIFNGKPDGQPHTGVDYATPVGSAVLAVADGTVVVAKDMFFEGKAVFIDHGDGLVSMYFHLSDIKVQPGQQVKKGHTIGLVGSTGRATGPHLFFGIRWHDARIDPQFLLEDPLKIPAVDRVSQ